MRRGLEERQDIERQDIERQESGLEEDKIFRGKRQDFLKARGQEARLEEG